MRVKIITAAITHHRWGTPSLPGKNWRTSNDAKKMKLNLLTGSTSVLTPPGKPRKMIYPKQVEDIAIEHWNENTIVEPALHNRRAVTDDKETIPTRYQSLTDKEQYSLFKEECSVRIGAIMRRDAVDKITKLSRKPDNADRAKRLNYYENLHTKFPSIDWYLDKKPEEVKPLHDHTTALCRVCEAALLNYTTVVKTIKRLCQCKTWRCPNWICFCITDDNEEGAAVTCSCKCAFENCSKCKVS